MVLLGYLALAFKTWMLVDAMRRRVPALWYLVVVLPAGDFLYFFAIKLRDHNVRPHEPALAEAGERGPTLEQLEAAALESPSFRNRVTLAWARYDRGESARARALFELCLTSHPKDNEAAYGLGLCLLEQGEFAPAVAALMQLVDRNFAYQDYAAAEALAEALLRDQRADEACTLHADIAKATRRIDHRVAQAKVLIRCKRREVARDVLVSALSDFEAQASEERRREGAVATEARRLLRTLPPPAA